MADNKDKDFDWIFDFMLQFLESDRFDAAVMDFIDEKCECFGHVFSLSLNGRDGHANLNSKPQRAA